MNGIYKIDEVDPSKIILGNAKDKNIEFFYPTDEKGKFEKLRVQFPAMKIPFDLDEKTAKDGNVFVKNVTLSIQNVLPDEEELSEKLPLTMFAIDERIKHLMKERGCDNILYSSLLKPKNAKYSPTFRVSVFCNKGKPRAHCFDENEKEIPFSIDKNDVIAVIAKLDNVWLSNGKAGVTWTVEQVKMCKPPQAPVRFRSGSESDSN